MSDEAVRRGLEFIDPWIEQRVRDLDLTGAAYAVMHKGELIHAGAHGYADHSSQTPLTPQHIFKMASQSKPLTATAMLQLSESEELDIDTRIGDVIPELDTAVDDRWRQVTVSQLLSHGSGVSRDGDNADFWELKRDFPSCDELLTTATSRELVFEPGTQMKYSNVGYGLLGIALKNVTGEDYELYVKKHIFDKTLVDSSGYDTMYTDAVLATGHSRQGIIGGDNNYDNRQALPQPPLRAYSPAAGLRAPVTDMAKIMDRIVFDRDSESPLSSESRQTMQQPVYPVKHSPQIEYALGMDIGRINGRRMWGHGGGYAGFLSKTLIDKENEVVITCATNCMDGDALSMAIGAMEAICFYRDYDSPYPSTSNTKNLDVRLEGTFNDCQIVAASGKIVAFDPHQWHPFRGPNELEVVDQNRLRFIVANGFDADGEYVVYDRSNESAAVCGKSMAIVESFRVRR